jgi:hypothetical protein
MSEGSGPHRGVWCERHYLTGWPTAAEPTSATSPCSAATTTVNSTDCGFLRHRVGYRRAVAVKDPYELLGVPRDASDERIRAAYELAINRATRDGAIRYAAELSAAYDTVSSARRRELYERHGFTAIRERSPGSAPPPNSWRVGPSNSARERPHRRSLVKPLLLLLVVIVIVGLFAARLLTTEPVQGGVPNPASTSSGVQPPRLQHVLCQGTPGGIGYTYTEPVTNRPHCTNGAQPVVVGHS